MSDGANIYPVNLNLTTEAGTTAMKLRLDAGQMSHRNILEALQKGQMYEPTLSHFLTGSLQKGDRFIDIGAHVGFFSILAGHLVGETGQVTAIEGNEENFSWLQEHATQNELQNIRAHHAVACNTDDGIYFFENTDNDGGHALWDPGLHDFNAKSRAAPKKHRMPSLRLERLLLDKTLPPCRIIKIDTEGAELTVLQGGGDAITPDNVPFIVCEINAFGLHQMGANTEMLREYMRERGYQTFHFPSQPGQLPTLVPTKTSLVSPYVFNVIFTTLDAVGEEWPQVQPPVE